MKDIIEIKSGLEPDISSGFAEVKRLFDSLEETYSRLSGKLQDGKWTGVANLQCRDLQDLIIAYEQSVRPLFNSFKSSCTSMLGSVDGFCASSHNVTGLQNW